MDAKTIRTIEKLKNDRDLAQKIMSGSEGQKLMELLTARDDGAALSQAAQKAENGDTKALSQLLGEVMKSSEGKNLMQRLSELTQK